ncbi:MAG: DUF2946 family protein [Pseudomonadota bacterium]
MKHFRLKFPELKSVVAALLFLPFVLTAFIPQGFMPSVQAEGGFTVTLCTTDGLRTITLDANGVEIPPGSDEDPDTGAMEHCVFAGVGSFLDTVETPQVALPSVLAQQASVLRTITWWPSAVSGQHGARAPPHVV